MALVDGRAGYACHRHKLRRPAHHLYPSASVGIIAGLSGGGAALGAMTMMLTIGWVVDHFSYTPILILASALGPLATTALLVLIGRPAAD